MVMKAKLALIKQDDRRDRPSSHCFVDVGKWPHKHDSRNRSIYATSRTQQLYGWRN